MSLASFLVQAINGLAEASALFLVASGLSLIFGTTRIVNFAHGSLFMLGLYLAVDLVARAGASAPGFWAALLCAALLVAALGAVIEIVLLRRIYRAPEMFQLLATFALVLILNDAALWLWGAEDVLGPLAPGLEGALRVLGRFVPAYDIFLIVVGPVALAALGWGLTRTRWGALVRAATQDRDMLGALGVNPAWIFTSVFALGAFLAGLGGALQLPRQPASLALDLSIIADVFVVVVVGGLGSIKGTYLAALFIAQVKALCIALGVIDIFGLEIAFPKLTLVVEFLCMALVLVFKPWGLCGKALGVPRAQAGAGVVALTPAGKRTRALWWAVLVAVLLLPALSAPLPYATVLAQDILIAALFAASLGFMMGAGGMVSFGHAAYFGLGAYAAALLFKLAGFSALAAIVCAPVLALACALAFGWFCVRLSGVYLAMLTLAFAQIVWAIAFQWDAVTGGSNGIIGVWPPAWLAGSGYFYLVCAAACGLIVLLRRAVFSPLGYALRAARDARLRAQACGIDVARVQWAAFVLVGSVAGVAGALFAFAKGGVSPEGMAIGRSVDALLMVLLGGVQALAGPVAGAAGFTLLQDGLIGVTPYWRALLGGVMLALVLVWPEGLAAGFTRMGARVRAWGMRRA